MYSLEIFLTYVFFDNKCILFFLKIKRNKRYTFFEKVSAYDNVK